MHRIARQKSFQLAILLFADAENIEETTIAYARLDDAGKS